MRYVYLSLIVLFTAIVLTFQLQNLEVVTVNFLSFSLAIRTSYLFFLTYLLGMLSGGFLFKLLKSWAIKARDVKPHP